MASMDYMDDVDCFKTGALVDLFCKYWGGTARWINKYDGGPHEAAFLKLDCTKLKNTFNWKPKWNLEKAIEKTVEWYKCWIGKGDIDRCMDNQIKEFFDYVEK